MRPQGLEEHAQPAVDQRDRPGVGPSQPEQLGLAEHVADRAGRDVDQGRDLLEVDLVVVVLGHLLDEVPLLAGLELVGLDGDVLVAIGLGRVPGPVRAEEVEPEHERVLLAPLPFQPVDGGLDGARDPGVLLVDVAMEHGPIAQELLPAGLSRARGRDRPRAGAAARARPRAGPSARRGSLGGHERVIALAANPDDLVEPAAEAHAGLAEQGDVGDQGRPHPLVPEHVGQDQLVGPERGPALIGVGEAVPAGPPAPTGRQGGQVLGEVVVEDDPLGRQAVQVGVSIQALP